MKINPNASQVLLIASAACAFAAAACLAQAAPRSSAGAASTKGDAKDFLEALHRLSGDSIIAEPPSEPARRVQEIVPDTPQELIASLCKQFGYGVARQGSTLLLTRRYFDPSVDHQISHRDLTASVARLNNTLKPIAPAFNIASIRDKRSFTDGLTSYQRLQMQGKGLPFTGLSSEQRLLWQRISFVQAYADPGKLASRLHRLVENLPNATLSLPRKQGDRVVLQTGSPLGTIDLGPYRSGLSPTHPGAETSQRIPLWTEPLMLIGGDPVRDSSIRATFREAPVSEWSQIIARASQMHVALPEWSTSRSIIALGSPLRTSELLTAVEHFYGYIPTKTSSERYSLRLRHDRSIGTDPETIHRRIATSLPPALLRSWSPEGTTVNRLRQNNRLRRLVDLAQKEAPGRNSVTVSKLGSEAKDVLWAYLVDKELLPVMQRYAGRTVAPRWLSKPENGTFRITKAQGGLEFLTFQVPTEGGRPDRWGWYINTSSLN